MGLSSAPMGLTSWAAGSPLKIVLCVVTMRRAVSPRAGCVTATPTVLTGAMNKDAVSAVQLTSGDLVFYEVATDPECTDPTSLPIHRRGTGQRF